MSRRWAALLSWSMWVLGVAGIVVGVLLKAPESSESRWDDLIWVSSFVGFGLVGALLVSNRPSNRIGWLLSGVTFSVGFGLLAGAYGRYALVTDPGTLPLGDLAAWVTTWWVILPVTLVVFLILLYPTGEFTTRLGRLVAKAFLFVAALDLASYGLRPGPVEPVGVSPDNPWAISGAKPFLDGVITTLGPALALLFVIAVVDLFIRFRRSHGVERQQFRWFFTAFAIFPLLFILVNLLEPWISGEDGFDPTTIIYPLWGIGTAAAISIAITRHGLYEIDRIISRTVSYTVVVVALGGVYVGGVTWLTFLLPDQSQLVVAATTLAVAALFTPLRMRVQAAVDRRFNRSAYDTELVMDRFSGSLRDEVDPDRVVLGWVGVVSETMEPAAVGVWVKTGP